MIVPSDANENILFLKIFLVPSLIPYKNLLNIIGPLISSCSICPSSIKITRLPISLTNSLLCVTTKTVVPLLLISERSSMIPLAVTGSRFPVGSSASNNTGWFTKLLRWPLSAVLLLTIHSEKHSCGLSAPPSQAYSQPDA